MLYLIYHENLSTTFCIRAEYHAFGIKRLYVHGENSDVDCLQKQARSARRSHSTMGSSRCVHLVWSQVHATVVCCKYSTGFCWFPGITQYRKSGASTGVLRFISRCRQSGHITKVQSEFLPCCSTTKPRQKQIWIHHKPCVSASTADPRCTTDGGAEG